MFIDRAIIRVKAGKGGDGCMSFYRGKATPRGGPDGGNGGDGGSIILTTDEGVNTLNDFRYKRDWLGKNGEQGRGKQQYGAGADDRIIRVPAGTMVYEEETGELLADLDEGDSVVVAQGGKGGLGNEHFKSATNQAPRQFTPGTLGEEKYLRLELKLIAEIGLIGLPNAGKSTLLKALTRADPKIADYPFTTLSPQLGIAELDPARRVILADIPGLIAGAADGAGLGHEFLRHIERTKMVVHVLDADPSDGSTPSENYRVVRDELTKYSTTLAEKPELIVLNKTDLLDEELIENAIGELRTTLQLGHDEEILVISGATRTGLIELLERCHKIVHPKQVVSDGWKPVPESM